MIKSTAFNAVGFGGLMQSAAVIKLLVFGFCLALHSAVLVSSCLAMQ
jgi:hypothetical protein